MMKINYFILRDVVHGRPVIEEVEITLEELEEKFHPDEVKKNSQCCFLDIQIEDESLPVDKNKEILDLSEILDISLDTLEEIITDQRPRLDDYIEYLLILFKSVGKHPTEVDEKTECQIGLKIYDNVVISLHLGVPIELEHLYRMFSRNPLTLVQGRITYLASNYLDNLIDPTYIVLDSWRKETAEKERAILDNPKMDDLDILIGIRQSLFDLIKIMQADREVINRMRSAKVPIFENDFIPPELDDHIKHLLDESDILRAIISDLMNIYYSAESSKLNLTLARFTIFTSLLLLPSLVAGIFGMNNVGFPSISFGWAIVIMLVLMGMLLGFFKKKKLI
jgi:magnesium transporter